MASATYNATYPPLWYVEEPRGVGACQATTIDRPQPSEDPEQGALATSIGARDEEVHARGDLQQRGCHTREDVTMQGKT